MRVHLGHTPHSWRAALGSLLVAFSVVALASCGQAAAAGTPASTPTAAGSVGAAAADHVVIIPQTDLFTPYIVVINAGDSVTWMNDDTMLHTVVSAPRAAGGTIDPTPFQLVLQPGQQGTVTLRQAGVYYYYCGAHAALTAQGRAAAFTSVRPYPLPMDGIIYVQGPGLSAGSSATVALSSNDQLTPWITVLNLGATVTWSNQTTKAQDLVTIPGYGSVNPQPLGVHVAAGGTASFTFHTPGIYDYYATGSATLDPIWQRASARSGTAGYPVPMEGVIAILNY